MLFCPNCGTKLEEGSRFCGSCGAPVSSQAGEQNILQEQKMPWEQSLPQEENVPWEQNKSQEQKVPWEQSMPQEQNGTQTPLRPSQMKKARQQEQGGSQITIRKPTVNLKEHKPSFKKLRASQIVVMVEVAVLILVLVGFFAIGNSKNSAGAIAKKYAEAYFSGDWDTVYDMIDYPNGEHLQKAQFIAMRENVTLPDIASYEVVEIQEARPMSGLWGNEMNSMEGRNSNVQKSFAVNYTVKGQGQNSMTVTLWKQDYKDMVFFDTWKVSSENQVAENFSIYVPREAEIAIDGIVINKENRLYTEENTTLAQYQLALFTGEHNLQVSVPWCELYETTFTATSESSFTPEEMILTAEGEQALTAKMQEALEICYQAAVEKKDFSEVEDLFVDEYKERAKESYEYLVNNLHESERYVLNNVTFYNFACEFYPDYDGTIYGEMNYQYDMGYTYISSSRTTSESTTGESSYIVVR